MTEITATLRPALVDGNRKVAEVTQDISRPMEGRPTWMWWAGLAVSVSLLGIGAVAVGSLVPTGIGTWGVHRTVGLGCHLANFVFWLGHGHACREGQERAGHSWACGGVEGLLSECKCHH